MSKVDGNFLCSCGSGLIYGRCHGSIMKNISQIPSGNVLLNPTEKRIPLVGFPGAHQTFHMRPRLENGEPRNQLPLEGLPGLYEVTFVLHCPGYRLQPESQLSLASGLRGDSHLAIMKPSHSSSWNFNVSKIQITARTEDEVFKFVGLPNAKGHLGKFISTPFHANNWRHAEEIAYRAIALYLSLTSVNLDIPLEIGHRETKELSTGSISTSFVSPLLVAPIVTNATPISMPEFRSYAALYREALNTNNPVFEFLCLFKIIESLRARRTRLEREARKTNVAYTPPSEILPGTLAQIKTWLESIFYVRRDFDLATLDSAVPADLRGLPAADVIKNVLKPLRHNIAHALIGSEGELPLSADDLLHTHKVTSRLLVTKCLVRRMLKNDFPDDFLYYMPG